MAAPVMLRVILGENDSTRLTLPNGIPESVDDLIPHIKNQLELEGDIRLQFMDQEFGNEFNNLTSTSEIEDKSTIKVIHQPFIIIAGNHLDDSTPPSPHSSCPPPPFPSPYPSSSSLSTSPSIASCDTDILSSPEASSSRSSAWPLIFKVPRFPYDAELELEKANAALKDDGTLLDPGTKLKSSILNGLMEEIMKYKVYPSDTELGEIAEALVTTHPCLKEPGSKTGYEGWKTSLRWKIGNYRTRLRRLGHPEVAVNAQTNKRVGSSPASGVKKARKAEVNFCPALPSGETMDTQESKRVALLSEVDKRNNESHVTQLMDQTFSLRRQEVMQEPLIAEFKTRWPALFTVREVCAEFRRITTVNLESKFFFNLDAYSPNLMKAFSRKGGSVGQSLRRIMLPISQDSDINVRRECILKGLCTYFKEDPGKLLKEYM
ncbi:sterile alpha motif domain-containing protein 3-like, partial [Engraulis encrasicolus]|uniref:sterile alpha motif domain-containing protein 3-like n=1 Tax=Engraulis encrasicolus TaxID=184585 RepID=UPI002FD0C2BF